VGRKNRDGITDKKYMGRTFWVGKNDLGFWKTAHLGGGGGKNEKKVF